MPCPLLPPPKGQAFHVGSGPHCLRIPRTLFSSCLLSTTTSTSLLQNNGRLLALHLLSSIALFFWSSSQTNFLESVYTSCLYFLTFHSLSNPFQPGFHFPNSTEAAFVKSLAPSLLPSLLNTLLSSPSSASQKHSAQLAAAPFWNALLSRPP